MSIYIESTIYPKQVDDLQELIAFALDRWASLDSKTKKALLPKINRLQNLVNGALEGLP
jgi:hypothetical protein